MKSLLLYRSDAHREIEFNPFRITGLLLPDRLRRAFCSLGSILLGITFLMIHAGAVAQPPPANTGYGSHPLENWEWRNPLPTGSEIGATAYGNGRFVAVGLGGAIYTSPDTQNWTRVISGTSTILTSIAYGGGKFVAVGWNGTVIRSADGISWGTVPSGVTETLARVTYANGMFVAVGGPDGVIITSTDGSNWARANIDGYSDAFYSVCYGNGVFLAGGRDASPANLGSNFMLFRSTDGLNWFRVQSNVTNQQVSDIAFGNGYFVTGSAIGGIRSTDGLTWAANTSGSDVGFFAITFGNGFFVAANNKHVYRSGDGFSWSEVITLSDDIEGQFSSVSFANGLFVIPHTYPTGSIHRSADGINWTVTGGSNAASGWLVLNSVVYGSGRYVTVGSSGLIRVSASGRTWQTAPPVTAADLYSVSFADGVFVAVGYDFSVGEAVVLRSTDGSQWSTVPGALGGGNLFPTVSFVQGQFHVLDYLGGIYRSENGTTWEQFSTGPGAQGMRGITYGAGLYIMVGDAGAIYSSPDGTTWTDHSSGPVYDGNWSWALQNPSGPSFSTVTYGNGIFVALGEAGAIVSSDDGTQWVSRGNPVDIHGNGSISASGLAFTDGHFVAAGDYAIIYSSDSVTWNLAFADDAIWRGVATGAGSVVAVGTFGAIAQVTPGLGSLNPSSITAGSATFTMTVSGEAFPSGATVYWGTEALPTTFINDTQLTAEVSSGKIVSNLELVTLPITVRNPNGATSFPKAFAITAANVENVQSVIAGAGATVSVSTAPTESSGTSTGIEATLLNSGDVTPVTVSAAIYSSNPSPSTAFDVAGNSELAGNFLDLKVTGADPQDQLASNFYYPSGVTGVEEDSLTLKYYNGSDWVNVLSSGGTAPLKNTTDNLDGTVSGGRFAVYFDNTSTPKITELSGTFFAVALPRPPLGFTGFLAPIGGADTLGGSYASPLRTFKAGSTVPVKFKISRTGVGVTSGVHRLQAKKWSDATTAATPIDATPQEAVTSGNQFVLRGDEWHFNLDTKATGLTKGIWQLIVTLSDGTDHTVWIQVK